MIANYPDKSAKVIRFKIKKRVSEGERRKEFNSVIPLGRFFMLFISLL